MMTSGTLIPMGILIAGPRLTMSVSSLPCHPLAVTGDFYRDVMSRR
jgi:hypothetical protein